MINQNTKKIINWRGHYGKSEALPKGSGNLLCELADQITDPHEMLPTRNQIISASSCQMFVVGEKGVGGGVNREMLEIKRRKRGMPLGRVLRYPRSSWVQQKYLMLLSVSIRTLRSVKPRRVVVAQFFGLSAPPSSGPNIHKVCTCFTWGTNQSMAVCYGWSSFDRKHVEFGPGLWKPC
jgi:hypothetical protein